MENNRKVLILYHSGAGSTKTIAEIYYKELKSYRIDISSINLDYEYKKLQSYEVLIFAFPTYHCSPSASMMTFIRNMPAFDKPKKAFAFTTCGLYAGNTLREFIKKCSAKNINVNGYATYRAPATDGVLLLPPIPFMFDYEKNIAYKIKEDIKKLDVIIKADTNKVECPAFKLYTLLNYPNRALGRAYKHKFTLLEKDCINCSKCVDNCIQKCWHKTEKYPRYEAEKCESCFKCIHHCPKEAIILTVKTKKKIKLNEKFYSDLKEKIILKTL
jgi:flavodoxin/ferredoxin